MLAHGGLGLALPVGAQRGLDGAQLLAQWRFRRQCLLNLLLPGQGQHGQQIFKFTNIG